MHEHAAKDEKLRLLFPFVGIAGFGFSKVCDYPFFVDVLISHLGDDQFGVRVSSGDGGWANMDLVAEGSAKTCVEIASGVLPVDYGAAILGDANDWRRVKGIPPVDLPFD